MLPRYIRNLGLEFHPYFTPSGEPDGGSLSCKGFVKFFEEPHTYHLFNKYPLFQWKLENKTAY